MAKFALTARAVMFYLGCVPVAIWLCLSTLPLLPFLSFERRYRYLLLFNRWANLWLQLCCQVRYQLIGTENLPVGTCILTPKHQSTWETLFLPLISPHPVASIGRSNLRWLPFFGLGMIMMGGIFIQRSNPRQAMQIVQEQGRERLQRGMNMIIFPEGTRTPPGQTRPFKRGAARVAQAAGVPLVPIALNSGECWARNTLIKSPGVITISIGPPIDSGSGSVQQITEQAQAWVENEMKRLPAVR